MKHLTTVYTLCLFVNHHLEALACKFSKPPLDQWRNSGVDKVGKVQGLRVQGPPSSSQKK